ncbi:MAG: ABC transporter permease, partial [Microvirga sp.]
MTDHIATEPLLPVGVPPVAARGAAARLLRRPLALFGLALVALVVLAAALAPWLSPFDPNEQFFDGLTIEGAPLPPNAVYWLGTDLLGRDMLSRVIHGTFTALAGPLVVAAGAFALATILGLLAGYLGGWVDIAIMRWVDFMFGLPSTLIAIVVVGVIGGGYWT